MKSGFLIGIQVLRKGRDEVDRSSSCGRPELVAVAAVGADRIWKFSVSITVVFRRKWTSR